MNQTPIKRSSVHHVQSHHHAQFTIRHGWEMAVSYGNPSIEKEAAQKSVALVDVSWLGKFECKGAWVSSLESETMKDASFYKLIPIHGIWIVQPDAIQATSEKLETKRSAFPRSYLINTSSAYASFSLLGPAAANVLSKLSSVQVAAGNHAQWMVAGVHCLIIRHANEFRFHFAREFGEYMWECFLDAGAEFKIQPAGPEAVAA